MTTAAKDPRAGVRATEEPLTLSRLEGYLGFHLKMAQAAMRREFIEALASVGMTQRKHAVLMLISENAHPSQSQVAAALQIDRATMMTIVDRLEEQGLVTRLRAKEDRRRQELALTDAGHKLLKQADARVEQHESDMAARFTPDELGVLTRALRKLYEAPASSD